MGIEKMIQMLIYTYAIFGGIALLTGFISLVSIKGEVVHRKS
jgi:hypothetical protein